jgi:hypothetical protein
MKINRLKYFNIKKKIVNFNIRILFNININININKK